MLQLVDIQDLASLAAMDFGDGRVLA